MTDIAVDTQIGSSFKWLHVSETCRALSFMSLVPFLPVSRVVEDHEPEDYGKFLPSIHSAIESGSPTIIEAHEDLSFEADRLVRFAEKVIQNSEEFPEEFSKVIEQEFFNLLG